MTLNARQIMQDGHQTVLQTIDGLAGQAWHTPNVCGAWSSKDILAHLASFEEVLVEVLTSLRDSSQPTPLLNRLLADKSFNDSEVAARRDKSVEQVLADYEAAHRQAMALAEQLPDETFRRPGTLSWYGAQYALDDFIVYMFYGHKREHTAQVKLFRNRSA